LVERIIIFKILASLALLLWVVLELGVASLDFGSFHAFKVLLLISVTIHPGRRVVLGRLVVVIWLCVMVGISILVPSPLA